MPLPANATYYRLVSHRAAAASLKSQRINNKLTGSEAAELVGLTQPQLSKIENGHQEFFTDKVKAKLDDLAKQLGATLKWAEGDWREEEHKVRTVTAQAPVQSKAKPRLEDQFRMVMDLYDAGVLDRDGVLNGLSKMLEVR